MKRDEHLFSSEYLLPSESREVLDPVAKAPGALAVGEPREAWLVKLRRAREAKSQMAKARVAFLRDKPEIFEAAQARFLEAGGEPAKMAARLDETWVYLAGDERAWALAASARRGDYAWVERLAKLGVGQATSQQESMPAKAFFPKEPKSSASVGQQALFECAHARRDGAKGKADKACVALVQAGVDPFAYRAKSSIAPGAGPVDALAVAAYMGLPKAVGAIVALVQDPAAAGSRSARGSLSLSRARGIAARSWEESRDPSVKECLGLIEGRLAAIGKPEEASPASALLVAAEPPADLPAMLALAMREIERLGSVVASLQKRMEAMEEASSAEPPSARPSPIRGLGALVAASWSSAPARRQAAPPALAQRGAKPKP